MIAEVLSESATQKSERGKLLFAGLFATLNAQRSSVMGGLERVTRKQREAADKIRHDTLALHAFLGVEVVEEDSDAQAQAPLNILLLP